ncbi:MAG TPA: ATP-binding protein, partial [Candidatus Binataceae bacterium]|nr:ATP-binding protein [Candidatus Binataceae bacterium]
SVYYITITAMLTVAYLGFLGIANWVLRSSAIAQSSIFPLLFTFTVVLAFNPMKDAVQQAVDRIFFRVGYSPRKILEATGAALAATLQLDDIVALVWRTITEAIPVAGGAIFLRSAEGGRYEGIFPSSGQAVAGKGLAALAGLTRSRGRVVSRYSLVEESSDQGSPETLLDLLAAELIIPLKVEDDLKGFIALGKKESGEFFSTDDIDFLCALANQSALSIGNALAYREIRNLNAVLEQRVAQRTEELSVSNRDLEASVRRLEQAYSDLQRSQTELSRAEKMATLGRLAAGIAHEVNTPLGASMTSLKILRDLVDEYAASAADPAVTASDHREIAGEMRGLLSSATDWLRKAAAHIGSLKVHTRALRNVDEKTFPVIQIVEGVTLLLSHRLRLAQSRVTIDSLPENPVLFGDPGKLGQVLTNLLSNAIDANLEAMKQDAEIRIAIREDGHSLTIAVSDQGPGIPAENLEKIFDEFYSTKPAGEGTGLGLSIARDIVANYFKGSISVESVRGRGSTFTLELARAGSTRHDSAAA